MNKNGSYSRKYPELTGETLTKIIISGRAYCRVAEEMGIPSATLKDTIRRFKKEMGWQTPTQDTQPEIIKSKDDEFFEDRISGRTIDEILDSQQKQYEQVRHSFEEINIKMKEDLPVAIIHYGDPHLGSDGMNMELLKKHMELSKKDGVYVGCVGDITDNWCKPLAGEYGNSVLTKAEQETLEAWFIDFHKHKWVYMIVGNHDEWNSHERVIEMLFNLRQKGRTAVKNWEGVFNLIFKNGATFKIKAAHDFKGGSQFSNSTGGSKLRFQGDDADIFICGHRHCYGYENGQNLITHKFSHSIRAAGYKRYDNYARRLQFHSAMMGESVVTVLDPLSDNDVSRIQVFADPVEGVEYMEFLRNKYKRLKNKRGRK